MRESVDTKAARYVSEGRLIVELVHEGKIAARCRGAGALYRVGFDGRWRCDCPARTHCAHIAALQLVTVAPREPERA